MGWANECIECGISVTNGSKCQKRAQLGRGRAQGLVGFGLCRTACPLPYCALNCGLCLGRLPIPYALSDSSVFGRFR